LENLSFDLAPPPFEIKKVEHKIIRQVGKAIEDFSLIEDGDRIMVGMSGGKDSYLLLDVLRHFQKKAPISFELVPVHLNQGHPGFQLHILEKYLKNMDIPYNIINQNTYDIVKKTLDPSQTTCSLCSRLRRGILYNAAVSMGLNKIALGHHRDDLIETVLLNMFFSGQLKTMPPKLISNDKRNIVIRPMAYVSEENIKIIAKQKKYPILPCTLCSQQDNLQRNRIKSILRDQEEKFPGSKSSILNSLKNIVPSHLLDKSIH